MSYCTTGRPSGPSRYRGVSVTSGRSATTTPAACTPVCRVIPSIPFAISTTRFLGSNGRVEQIEWAQNIGRPPFDLVPETAETHPADLVLLAMGFLGPEQTLLDQLGVKRDERSNASAVNYATSADGVFAAGDARRGQSLIVWAINEGRRCARAVEQRFAATPR